MKGKDNENYSKHNSLDALNPNHIKFIDNDLIFEVLGGVNTESYSMLRVMIVVRGQNNVTERGNVDLYNSYQLSTFIKKIAERTGMSLKKVEEAFQNLTNQLESYKHELIEKRQVKYVDEIVLTPEQEAKAKEVLTSTNLLDKTVKLMAKAGVIGNEQNSLVLFLLYLSRFHTSPLHAVVLNKYNYLQEAIGGLVPPEQKKVISHLTDNALFYFEEDELANMLLLVEDTGNNKSKLLPLLELQTKGKLTKTVTQKDSDGYLRTVQRSVNGPICLSLATPNEQAYSGNSTLSFVLTEDSSNQQDELMMNYQRRQSAGLVNKFDELNVANLLMNMQRLLKPTKVVNPFAEQLILPQQLIDKQLTNVHYLRFIEMVSFYKQYQKEQKADEQTGEIYIETNIEDIKEANELLAGILLKKCDGLNTPTRNYFEQLKKHVTDEDAKEFTNNNIHIWTGIPISTIKRYNAALISKGYMKPTGEGNRATGFMYSINDLNEYDKLKKDVTASLTIIKKFKSSPSPKVAQKENERPKTSNNNGLSKVVQKTNKVQVSDSSNNLKKAI